MLDIDLRHPSPDEMIQKLIDATEVKRWNHFRKDFKGHRDDWVKIRDTRKPLTKQQYMRLPKALAEYPYVQLCAYSYYGRTVWGFYTRRLPFEGIFLSQVGVVYAPEEDEIIHCMRVNNRTNYFERQREFVEIRW